MGKQALHFTGSLTQKFPFFAIDCAHVMSQITAFLPPSLAYLNTYLRGPLCSIRLWDFSLPGLASAARPQKKEPESEGTQCTGGQGNV